MPTYRAAVTRVSRSAMHRFRRAQGVPSRKGDYETSQSGTARRWSFLQWRDHNRLACALDNWLQLVLLRLRHPELVQGLLKIAHEDLPFVRRDHEVPMGVPHRTTRVLLRAAGG